jgi:protein phosphatase
VRTVRADRIGRNRTSIGRSRLLLCSDGVHKLTEISRIRAVLADQPSPSVAANTLVEFAHLIGGKDNATAMIIDPPPVHGAALAA